jgi:hypothetical protein
MKRQYALNIKKWLILVFFLGCGNHIIAASMASPVAADDMHIAFKYLPAKDHLHLLPQIISIEHNQKQDPVFIRLHFDDDQRFETKLHFNKKYGLYMSPHHGWLGGSYVVWLQTHDQKLSISMFHINDQDESFLIYYDISGINSGDSNSDNGKEAENLKTANEKTASVNIIRDEELILKQEISWLWLN